MTYTQWKEQQRDRARRWIKAILVCWFKVTVKGEYAPPPKALIIANRTSIIDVLLLSVFLPERLTIALHPRLFKKHWVKLLFLFADVLSVDPAHPLTTRALIQAIQKGKRCVIFPQESSHYETHSLKIYDGPGFIIQKSGAPVIPVRIEGGEHSIFSINKRKNTIRLFPQITLHIMPVETFVVSGTETVKRHQISMQLYRLISDLTFSNFNKKHTLFSALIEGAELGTKNKRHIEDVNRTPITYKQFLTRCFILGRQFKKQTTAGEYVGVMMPTTTAGMITFFALQAYRRIPAMLNFSMGFYNIHSACVTANIKTIYTARQFVLTAKLEPLIDELKKAGIVVRYLEEFKPHIHLGHKIAGLVKGMFPSLSYRWIGEPIMPDQSALVLFTSGSEGVPKGVVLSHANLLANCYQMKARVDFSARDIFFNALPIFHCFGLTAGSLVPLTSGLSCFFYPSPLHYKIIPGLVYQTGATIMFGTDTFLNGYARAAGAHDFSSIRYIFAGAEKVKLQTMRHWMEQFGVKIYEGYGATEASPVISLNCPLAASFGSVGMLLPYMQARIEPVEGIAQGGRLFLQGPNIMKGYIDPNVAGAIIPVAQGWHDTGDIVTLDANGFITIAGRAKRFAKIAGEMVSLTLVEGIAATLWPELLHAAISVKCSRKGEQILLFSEAKTMEKSAFIQKVKEQGHSELLVPAQIYASAKIPILASGKIDYVTLEQMANTKME
ncbi:MAG: acyl-[ACP]--phospholipid O-acyltransferase [Legionella sp.]|nr:MAG: acyl-[ACP]--phospholipid O-acyltransferase [Legionella sp.]PJD99898.1 MAG: acyl-[ACP]--phospholipid O-acyltransferase [Legionella sp.]